ncbi:MAG: hypothetical protein ACREFZ_00925 [Acetobacteraceae bacterium]
MRRRISGYTLAVVDLLTALVVVFAAMAVLSILASQKRARAGVRPGAIIVTLRWDMARDADLDLWVRAPGETSVGFSSKTSADCDLLRDDLGRALDPSSRNQEMVVCRAAPAGEWVVDTMFYRSFDHVVPVAAEAKVERLGADGIVTILDRKFMLAWQGQQITVWRFSLDAHGALVPGSVNDLPMALYTGVSVDP